MDHAVFSSPTRLRIPTCRHILERGCFCRGAAVRGHAYCRHHLHSRVRLRKMARARRSTLGLGSFSLTSTAAIRHTEVQLLAALDAGRIDPASAPVLFSALRMVRGITRTIDRCEGSLQIRQPNPNRINQVAINSLGLQSYVENDS